METSMASPASSSLMVDLSEASAALFRCTEENLTALDLKQNCCQEEAIETMDRYSTEIKAPENDLESQVSEIESLRNELAKSNLAKSNPSNILVKIVELYPKQNKTSKYTAMNIHKKICLQHLSVRHVHMIVMTKRTCNFSSYNHSVKQVLLGKPFLSHQLLVLLLLKESGQTSCSCYASSSCHLPTSAAGCPPSRQTHFYKVENVVLDSSSLPST